MDEGADLAVKSHGEGIRVLHDQPQWLLLSPLPLPGKDDFSCRFVVNPQESFDGIVLIDGSRADEVEDILRRSRAFLTPVANLSEAPLPFADYQSRRGSILARMHEAVGELERIFRALCSLPESIRSSEDPETILLAHLSTRSRRLDPTYDANSRQGVSYPAAGLVEEPWRHAERLAAAGLLSRQFFDRLHCCPSCNSSRLSVREECSACRSADLLDEVTVHHFRCAHQAFEREFRKGDQLVCPKCQRKLRHFGVDYDKPGIATACRSCGHVDAEPLVGFVCLDCGSRHDNQAVTTKDWHRYELTSQGERSLLSAQLSARHDDTADRLNALRILVKQGLRVQSRYGRPLTVLKITFPKEQVASKQHGEVVAARARAQALEIVRGEIRESDFVVEAADGAFIYMPETDPTDVDIPRKRLIDRIDATLRVDLGVRIDSVQPKALIEAALATP